jgi:hypothetical protein
MANVKDGWKNWLIAALWSATILLAGAGYGSIKESLDKIHLYQAAQLKDWIDYKIGHEKDHTLFVRTLDRVCDYQAERLKKEGREPYYPILGNGKVK